MPASARVVMRLAFCSFVASMDVNSRRNLLCRHVVPRFNQQIRSRIDCGSKAHCSSYRSFVYVLTGPTCSSVRPDISCNGCVDRRELIYIDHYRPVARSVDEPVLLQFRDSCSSTVEVQARRGKNRAI